MPNKTQKYPNTLLLSILVLLAGASLSMHHVKIPTIMVELSADLQMDANMASWTMSIFTFAGIVLSIPSGSFIAKLGGKRVMLISAGFMITGSVIGGLSSNAMMLLISRAIEGIGYSLVSVAGPIAVRESCDPNQVGRAIGFWGAYVALGQIVAYNLTPVLYRAIGWKNVWFTYAVVTLLLSLAAQTVLRRPTESAHSASTDKEEPKNSAGLVQILKNRSFMFACLGFSVFTLLSMATITYFPQFAVEAGLMDSTEAAFVASIKMICCIFCSPLAGRLSEKIGKKKIFIAAILGSGIGTILVFQESRELIYIGMFVWGILGMCSPSMMYASVPELVGEKLAGKAMGFCIAMQNFGFFLGTTIFLPIQALVGGSYAVTTLAIAIPTTLIGMFLIGRSTVR